MGHRANLVLVEPGGWRLFYSRWAANGIYRSLVVGPDATASFVTAQEAQDPVHGWLDDVWAEGGLVMDLPARRLTWFGNDLVEDLATRRAAFALLAQTWSGWSLEWAYDGLGDLAASVGVDRAVVRVLDLEELTYGPAEDDEVERLVRSPEEDLPVNRQGSYQLLTVRAADTTAAWVLERPGVGAHLAWHGPALLERLPGPGRDRVRLGAIPMAGLHLDLAQRQAGIWTAETCPGLLPALDDLWPGWQTSFWGDDYERQVSSADGAVELPACDVTAAFAGLAARLLPGMWNRPGPVDLARLARALVTVDDALADKDP